MKAGYWPTTGVAISLPLEARATCQAAYWGKLLLAVALIAWCAALWIGFTQALSILTIVGLAAAMAGLRKPVLGLLGVGMLCTLDAPARIFLLTGGVLRWNTINYWLLLVILLSRPPAIFQRDPHSRLLRGLILLFGLELVVSPDFWAGLQSVLEVVVFFGVLVYFARGTRDPEVWYWLGLLNGVLGAIGGFIYYLGKARLPYADPNALADLQLTALSCICLGVRFSGVRRRGQTLLVFLTAANCVWVFLGGSRGGMAIAALCGLFQLSTTRGVLRRCLIAAAAVFAGLWLSLLFPDQRELALRRMEMLWDPNRSLANKTSGRSDLASDGWFIFVRHPLGVGTGGFAPVRAQYSLWYAGEGISNFKRGVEMVAHSGWVKVLVENGVPGVLLLAGYVLSFAVEGWRQRKRGLLGLGLLVTGTFAVGLIPHLFEHKGPWFLAAAATVLFRGQPVRARPPLSHGG